jgi:transposase-like protein
LKEVAEDVGVSVRTIHRRMVNILAQKQEEFVGIKICTDISTYESSVLILDATFFGRKGSDTQWGILVAQDGRSKKILGTKYIIQERVEDYKELLRSMKQQGYPIPLFAVVDGRNGVEAAIQNYYQIPVQTCQTHKIATIHRYLLKYPRIESYRRLKEIARDMIRTDKPSFIFMLESFRETYRADFEARVLDNKTLEYKRAHPRLHLAYNSLMRDIDRLFVSLDFIQTIRENIHTTNRIESVFSHLKPKVKLHRGLSKERRLSLALSLLWKE